MKRQAKKGDERLFPEAHHLDFAKQRKMIEAARLHDGYCATHGILCETHVGIREQQPISCRALISFLQGVRFPQPARRQLLHMHHAKALMFACNVVQNVCCGILRAIIYRDDFKVGIVDGRQRSERRRQLFLFVACRKNQRDARAIRIRSESKVPDPGKPERSPSRAQPMKNPEKCNRAKQHQSCDVLDLRGRNWCQRSPRGIIARDARLVETNTWVSALKIPIEATTLPNGLKVVVAPDTTAPVVTVGVYYKIGFRLEPQGRSGFAHLFEHMMFQGSANAPKMQHIKLINSSGGTLNGSTHYDVTNYFESVPSNALERVLWLEADRMRALKVDDENLRNQRDVVKEEVRVNVLNQPYAGFPWLDMPPVAFRNWANAHNFYGDFADLDAATLDDVQKFFKTYYAPSNAVLLLLGDVDVDEGFKLAERHFAGIPSGPQPDPAGIYEPPQIDERRRVV